MNYYELRDSIGFILNNAPAMHCLAVKDRASTVIGAMILLDRLLNYGNVEYLVTGLSYFAIDPEHQNSSVIQLTKKKMFEYVESNSDMSIGFARKVMDGYWYPHGYRGFTNFCQITVPVRVLPKPKSKLSSASTKECDLPLISDIYSNSYKNILGSLKRDLPLWTYYLKKSSRSQATFESLFMNQDIIGYVIRQNNIILETGIKAEFMREAAKYIAGYLREKNYNDAIFEVGRQHPLITYLSKNEHSIFTRYVWKGGHIVKIHSILAFLKKTSPIFELRAMESNLKDFDFVCNSIRFVFQNNSLSIESTDRRNNIFFQEADWPKLILGVVEPKYLIEFKADRNGSILNVLFPVMSPQVPWLDQF
jgi:hypothetical protein